MVIGISAVHFCLGLAAFADVFDRSSLFSSKHSRSPLMTWVLYALWLPNFVSRPPEPKGLCIFTEPTFTEPALAAAAWSAQNE